MDKYFHSVTLDEESCRGCTNCIKRCPTEAIRVMKGKARIISERCIDCGECIRVCPYHAKLAITDPLEAIKNFKYKIAIPAPTLYGQFHSKHSVNDILNGLLSIGFDDCFEVAGGAELVTAATKEYLKKENLKKPLISAACPAIVRLVQVRFPELIDNLVRIESPMEVSAETARKKAMEKTGLSSEDIGIFFISPCAAKVTSVKAPYEKEISDVDGVISIKEIYLKILEKLEKNQDKKELAKSSLLGIRWASSGGEALGLELDNFIAVDGIHNVIDIFEEIEDERLEDIDFVEALACTGGCLGGPLTVENTYLAKSRLKKHMEEAGVSEAIRLEPGSHEWESDIKYMPVMKLDEDIGEALKKLEKLEAINESLPGLDCGACGAPSCRALAEDIVRGNADETDCIFKLREKVRELAIQMSELESKMPPVLDKEEPKG